MSVRKNLSGSMKHIFTLLLATLLISAAKSQAVTILMPDSSTHVGYVMKTDSLRIKFSTDDWPTARWINKADILNYARIENRLSLNMPEEVATGNASQHFINAGGFGIASVLLMVGGVAASAAGAATGNKIVVYAGAGMSGAGLLFLIPTFTNITKGGKALKAKNL